MTALLVGITFVALGVAGALAFYVLRLARERRERHEARAAVLADRIGGHVREVDTLEPFVGRNVGDAVAAPMLFADVDSTPRPGRPWLLAAGVVVVAVALGGIYLASRSSGAAAASQGPAPIELTSLRHERSGETLVVTGVVHNPGHGRAYDDLAAVVFTFDRDGSYLTSGRAGLDYRRLSPGEESPFSITLPSAAGVARYRVSFRTDAAVVPHLDRRNHPAPIEGGDQ
jgi:hypothetical protein